MPRGPNKNDIPRALRSFDLSPRAILLLKDVVFADDPNQFRLFLAGSNRALTQRYTARAFRALPGCGRRTVEEVEHFMGSSDGVIPDEWGASISSIERCRLPLHFSSKSEATMTSDEKATLLLLMAAASPAVRKRTLYDLRSQLCERVREAERELQPIRRHAAGRIYNTHLCVVALSWWGATGEGQQPNASGPPSNSINRSEAVCNGYGEFFMAAMAPLARLFGPNLVPSGWPAIKQRIERMQLRSHPLLQPYGCRKRTTRG